MVDAGPAHTTHYRRDVTPTGKVKVFSRWNGKKRLLDATGLRPRHDGHKIVRFRVKDRWCDSSVKVWFRYQGSKTVRRSVSDVETLTVRSRVRSSR